MDTPITKRLIISGLTPAISAEDISRRLTSFGTVKAADGFGLENGVGQPRKFGYITLETTVGKLSKCMNLLSGSTWKGAKLRFGEAKPDFAERIAAENKNAAEEPPKKKTKRRGGVYAEDMSLVTPENAAQKPGWKVSSVGRITTPVKLRPAHPLIEPLEEKKVTKPRKANDKALEGEKKKRKRAKDPVTRARRKVIDMPKYGSTHLKGMFLDLEVSISTRKSPPRDVELEQDTSSSSESDNEPEVPARDPSPPPPPTSIIVAGPSKHKTESILSSPSRKLVPLQPISNPSIPEDTIDVQQEKAQTLNLLNSLFGQDDDDWVGRESVGSDIDVEELMKGDRMLVDDDGADFEEVPKNASGKTAEPAITTDESDDSDSSEGDDEMAMDGPEPQPSPVKPKSAQQIALKDLFAPREDEGGFSLLGHLDLDIELDEDAPFLAEQPMEQQQQQLYAPYVSSLPVTPPTTSMYQSQTIHAPLVLNPRQAMFFPLSSQEPSGIRARQRDVFDLAKDNGWNWRDPAVGFYRTGTEEDIKKRWEDSKGDLTRDWKRRCREAGKINRRKKGGVEDTEV